MSILKKNKTEKRDNKDSVITSRITKDEYKRFEDLCNETGHSVSEALRLLVLNEISVEEKRQPVSNAPEIVRQAPKSVSKPSSSLGRFTTTKWNVDGFLPCPLCQEWVSSSNFSRHVKTNHSMTTRELLETYTEQADKMVEERS